MKHKLILAALILVCLSAVVQAQSPNWAWAHGAGERNASIGNCIRASANGYVYVTGSFTYPSITFGNFTLTCDSPVQDVFVVKYDTAGRVIWANRAGVGSWTGTGAEGLAICTDKEGNVYVTGVFGGPSILFGDSNLVDYAIRPNMFLVKYDSSGNVIWARNPGATAIEYGQSVSADPNGNVYVAGWGNSLYLTFGNDTLSNHSGNGSAFAYLAKYDPNGNILWARSGGGDTSGDNYAYSVSTDSWGNAYLTGYFYSPFTIFGNDTLTKSTTGNGGNMFLVKYDSTGNVVWARSAGGTGEEIVNAVSTDINGNVYVVGNFGKTFITLGADTLTYSGASNNDIFIVKYNSSGNVLWAKQAVDGSGTGVSTDSRGNVYMTGDFLSETVDFGIDTLTNYNGTGSIFVVKYDSSGNAQWAVNSSSSAGRSSGESYGLTVDKEENVYITGLFADDIIFGDYTLTVGEPTLYLNYFIAKLGNNISTGVVNEENPSQVITVYPNPSKGVINFNGSQKGYSLEIYNLLGEKIYSASTTSTNCSVNLTGTAKGGYLYRVTKESVLIQSGIVITE